MEWIFVKMEQSFSDGYNQYISKDGRYIKNIWFDGYEEVFEIS